MLIKKGPRWFATVFLVTSESSRLSLEIWLLLSRLVFQNNLVTIVFHAQSYPFLVLLSPMRIDASCLQDVTREFSHIKLCFFRCILRSFCFVSCICIFKAKIRLLHAYLLRELS